MTNSAPLFSSPTRKKILISAIIGNMLEIYDFALYGYFAPIIAKLFFPQQDKFMSLIATFGVFAVGFLMRPVGAILFGFLGDRVGRKKALSASIILMAVPTTLIGLLPTYAQWGMWAGLLLLLCRLLQGLATGGEFTGAIIYITEHAPNQRRGLHGSWAMSGTFAGFLLGSGVSALFSGLLSAEALSDWGWRIPFILGLVLGVIGLYLRLRMPETPSFEKIQTENKVVKNPLFSAFQEGLKPMLIVAGLNFLPAASYYMTFVYFSSYVVLYLKLSLHEALLINTINMLILTVITPVMGHLSDKIGRKPILMFGAIGFVLLAWPLFLLMQQKSLGAIWFAQGIFTLLIASIFSVIPATLVELVATHIRFTAISLPYNISSALFGGIMPLIATVLIEKTASPVSPSFYLILAGIAMILVVLPLKDHSKMIK